MRKNHIVPDIYVHSIFSIDMEDLGKRGINGVIFDLDNTLIKWGDYVLNDKLRNHIRRYKENGFALCIVSNNAGEDIQSLARDLHIPIVAGAGKPSRKPFTKALNLMNKNPEETAMVGDQLFTDIVGGNRSGLLTILVAPISEREFFGTRLLRFLERKVLLHLQNKGLVDRLG